MQFIRQTLHRRKCLRTVPQLCIREQKAEFGETSWFCIVSILVSISHCQQREKKRQMALSERSSGWKICPFHFFPLNELKGHCHLISERITKAAGAEGFIHTSLWKPCMLCTHLSMLHHLLSPSLAFFHLVQQQGGI